MRPRADATSSPPARLRSIGIGDGNAALVFVIVPCLFCRHAEQVGRGDGDDAANEEHVLEEGGKGSIAKEWVQVTALGER